MPGARGGLAATDASYYEDADNVYGRQKIIKSPDQEVFESELEW